MQPTPLRQGGRPSKISEFIAKRMEDALRVGSPVRLACQYAGIAESTHFEWMQRGKDREPGFAEYSERLTVARGEGVYLGLATLLASKDGKSQAERLKMAYPEYFSPRLTIRHEEKATLIAKLSDELARVIEEHINDPALRARIAQAFMERSGAAVGDPNGHLDEETGSGDVPEL